jgi:hypothetical protein
LVDRIESIDVSSTQVGFCWDLLNWNDFWSFVFGKEWFSELDFLGTWNYIGVFNSFWVWNF